MTDFISNNLSTVCTQVLNLSGVIINAEGAGIEPAAAINYSHRF